MALQVPSDIDGWLSADFCTKVFIAKKRIFKTRQNGKITTMIELNATEKLDAEMSFAETGYNIGNDLETSMIKGYMFQIGNFKNFVVFILIG